MGNLVVENLCLGYDGKQIVSNLSFTVNQGDYLCIIGENGSGKSTLMKAILGLQNPISGSIRMDGELMNGKIGYLPQQTDAQNDFPATVQEVVLSGCLPSMSWVPFYRKKEKEKARKAMQEMEITSIANQSFRNLSGGQRQRVLLARALCSTEKMLLLDEPVSGLDPKVSNEMYQLVKSINQNDNITIIMISHDQNYALQDATHVLHIGDDIFFGTKKEFYQSKVGKNYFLKGGRDE